MNENLNLLVAFSAGLISFTSPCVLPIIPAYLSYLTGISLSELRDQGALKRKIILNALFFILGFSTIFLSLGFSASLIGNLFIIHKESIRIVGSLLIILLGIALTGIIKLPFLNYEKRFTLKKRKATYLGSFLIGITFAAGWTPCVGPILSAIIIMASNSSTTLKGGLLLLSYSLGIGLPFFLTALFLNSFLRLFERVKKYLFLIHILSGIFLIIIGILMLLR